MNRDRIKKLGSSPLNGNDAYAILGIVFDWMESETICPNDPGVREDGDIGLLKKKLEEAGYSYERET